MTDLIETESQQAGRPVVLSASSVNSYLDCELQWWFSYVLAERGETTLAKVIGIAVHDAVELSLRMARDRDTMADMAEIPEPSHAMLVRSFEAELALGPVRMEKFGPDAALAEAGVILDKYWETFPLMPGKPWLVEHAFEIEVEGIPYSGTVDRVDEDRVPDELVMADLKVVASRPSKGRYRLNLTGYDLGVEASTGRRPTLTVLDHFVRTKNPYHWPEWVDSPSPLDVAEFAGTLERVMEGISKEQFRPTGLDHPWTCLACPHARECGPYQRLQEGLNSGDGIDPEDDREWLG